MTQEVYPEHIYSIEISEDDPQHSQPDKILMQLKPHQKAALHKAVVMETHGKISYNVNSPELFMSGMYSNRRNINIKGEFNITTNIGIMGDIVGYGKTLTALSIIATVPCTNTYVNKQRIHSSFGRNHYGHFSANCDQDDICNNTQFINTTLVIVPRGPVYVQWERAVENNTRLRKLAIESLPAMRRLLPPPSATFQVIKAFFEQYDLVIIKNTCIKTLFDFYYVPLRNDPHPMLAWSRIMIDEAHDVLCKLPMFHFKFLWLISATYTSILDRSYGNRNQLAYVTREVLTDERVNLCLVKGRASFVKQSFDIPEPIEHYYICSMSRYLSLLQPFLSHTVQERINANDIAGAIKEMGGTDSTEQDIVLLVTKEIERDLGNKEKELDYVNTLDITEEQKIHKSFIIRNEITRLTEKRQNIIDRVTALSEKTCAICYENYNNPIMLPCTHVFCGKCLINWMQNGKVCPECRTDIHSQQLIAIVEQKERSEENTPIEMKSKEDTLLDMIRNKNDGKFLIFSRIDSGFWKLIELLRENNISFAEMKGNTPHMMRILEEFKNGQIKVILLNTYYAGSGIDMSFATDVVLFHTMGLDRVQAIGRAQRHGRTIPLHIHNLCYAHEMTN